MNAIPYGKQNITEDDKTAVLEALGSDFLTQGPRIAAFEQDFAEYVGSKYAVAVANGTGALHLCALALGVKPGDKVITSPITFSASANCICYCGGEIAFVDIDPKTYLLDLDKLRALLEAAPKGTYKGIVPVDFAGRSVDMEAVRRLADEFGCWIIEDACHAPGAFFHTTSNKQVKAGSGKYADLAIFSFHPVKHITAGEGGMITTNDLELYEKLIELRTHGITRNVERYFNDKDTAYGIAGLGEETYPGWYMEMQELGYNYRLTDIQAALAQSQLTRAEEGVARRREIARRYEEAFEGQPFLRGQSGAVEGHAYHLYVIEVEDRHELYKYLRTKSIFSQVHYVPVHLMPYYKQQGWKKGDFPNSENYYSRCLSLPMYPTLTDEEQHYVIDCINAYYKQ